MTTPEVGAVVVGAGIAGLAAALELQSSASEVFVIDASDRPGGVMRTDHVSGYVIERGPNTFQLKAPMWAFLKEQGLEAAVLAAEPASHLRFVFRQGRLVPVPMSPRAFLGTPLLSAGGKLRLLAEPLIRRGDGGDESVAEFLARRLGRQAVTGLVGPFLTGVYAGDENRLGAAAVFPTLVQLEREHRSLAWGGVRSALRRTRPRGRPGSWSAAEGLGPFARHLAERLVEPPALNSTVSAIGREGGGWRVEVSGPGGERSLRSERLVLATDAGAASRILAAVDPDLAGTLSGIEYAPVVGIPVGIDPEQVRTPIEGFGFLVPREEDLALLGCLFMSRLFPGRAPAGRQLLQCLLGGTRWPEAIDLPDDTLTKRVAEDLDRTLGLQAEPQSLGVTRWPRAIPQPDRHHAGRMREARARVAQLPGLALAGAYIEGVSVADSLASGVRAARDVGAV